MTTLFLLQYTAMLVMAVMALVTGITHFYVRRHYQLFEQARGLLILALLLFVLHYWLQMHYGFRAQGADVGAAVNILFYFPIGFLINLSLLHFVQGGKHDKRYCLGNVAGYLIIVAVIAEGYWRHGSMHIGRELYVADAIYILCLIWLNALPTHRLFKIYNRVEAETGNPTEVFEHCMRWGTIVLYAIGCFFQVTILDTSTVSVASPLAMLAICFYVCCFVSLGFNISQVADVLAPADEEPSEPSLSSDTSSVASAPASRRLSEEQTLHIEAALQRWLDEGGLRDPDASIVSLARRIGVSRQQLTAYLDCRYDCTFRIWLSGLRLEEAKRLIREHPNYSNDVIAQECGFTSDSQLYRVFRTSTGCTPKEWADKQR